MSRRRFIRCLFGDPLPALNREIDFLLEGPEKHHNSEFVAYVFGEQNCQALESRGVTCRLLHHEPWAFEQAARASWKFGNKFVALHKLLCFEAALEDADEIVALDWDCLQVHPLPGNFWGELAGGEPIRVPLYWWPVANPVHDFPGRWRVENVVVPEYSDLPSTFYPIPNAGFVYLRDRQLASELVRLAHALPESVEYTDETALALHIDRHYGWSGLENYYRHIEPPYCDGCVEGTSFGEQSTLALHTERSGLRVDKDIRFWHFGGEDTIAGYERLVAHFPDKSRSVVLPRSAPRPLWRRIVDTAWPRSAAAQNSGWRPRR